jgi:hypothetical protein
MMKLPARATTTIPLYVNEAKSDIRCVKSGWYAMDHDGKLSSGPYLSREECLNGQLVNVAPQETR